ncbi:MAG: hypothetical protein DRP47_12795 [Candidatus Zixiibacteriota bacterium]|nr:MAG: hypothetical protein DRP47_12795 [candidate division Zixibacteria bacterium]
MKIDEIIQRVKNEASQQSSVEVSRKIKPNTIWQKTEFRNKKNYHINELLAIEQDDMVATLYWCLLGRAPDSAAANYERQLSSGALSPVTLIDSLLRSAEGHKYNAKVEGLPLRLFLTRLKKLPFLGFILDLTTALRHLPAIRKQLSKLEETQRAVCRDLAIKADQVELDRKADRVELDRKADRVELDRKADRSELIAYREAVHYAERYFHCVNRDLQDLLSELQKTPLLSSTTPTVIVDKVARLADSTYDKLYLDFESLYRGSTADVRDLINAYQELLLPRDVVSEPAPLALDLGCGRGEMVGYLGQLGYAATGVDLNLLAIETCSEQGLKVEYGDAITHLQNCPDQSVSVISSLHLVEHLTNDELFQILQRSLQVLAPGGMLLLETPNPRNLLVGAGDFYRDFTHNKPLFPDTLKFLLDYFGYRHTQLYFFAETEVGQRQLVAAEDAHFDDLSDYLQVSRDYAVVGYKPCE